jgi:hypothetical protein
VNHLLTGCLGSSKKEKEEDDGNVEQLEDENKVLLNKVAKSACNQLLIYSTVEHLVEYDLSITSWYGFDKGHSSHIRLGAKKHARAYN